MKDIITSEVEKKNTAKFQEAENKKLLDIIINMAETLKRVVSYFNEIKVCEA